MNDINFIDEKIEEYNLNKESKILIAFDDMIVDMSSSEKLQWIVADLFIRDRKINISLFFTTKSSLAVPTFRLNSTNYFITKIQYRWEL